MFNVSWCKLTYFNRKTSKINAKCSQKTQNNHWKSLSGVSQTSGTSLTIPTFPICFLKRNSRFSSSISLVFPFKIGCFGFANEKLSYFFFFRYKIVIFAFE